jgi:glucokinase
VTCALGIDVGGTKIAAGLVDTATGAILAREAIATLAARGGKAVLDDTVDLARRLFAVAKHPVDRIGVGVPQLVDNAGRIRSAYNFDWKSAPVRECLAALAPTTIESDVRVAALAEAAFGAGKGHRQFAYVTVGTGLSYCLVLDGRPYAGANGFAIHFASSALHLLCDSCGAVNRPVLEDIAAGPAIAAAYERRSGRCVAGAESVLAAAAEGDAEAMAVVDAAADQLGPLVALIVNMLDPAAILFGGGLGLAPGCYRERLVAATRAHVWAGSCRDLPILPAALGADAGLIGAALAAMS